MLDKRRAEVLADMPSTDEEFEMQNQDAIFDERMKQARTEEERENLEKMYNNEEHISLYDKKNPDLKIIDVLNYEADVVVKDVTVGELLQKLKNIAYIGEKEGHQIGDMNMYQQTQMDETDLAMHKFRDGTDTEGRSLQEFAAGEDNIYAQRKRLAQ